jgi:hypothetical protein
VEPLALHHGVIERRVRVDGVRVKLVQRPECGGAVGLIAIGGEDGAVLPVRDGDVVPVRQPDDGVFHIGRREGRVDVVGRRRQLRRQRQQVLALVVEHVFLLAIELLDREPIDRELRIRVHPPAHGVERNREHLRVEPGHRLAPLRREDLHLLAAAVNRVVALIFVVLE